MSDRFATGQIGAAHLTSDGTAEGIPARARIEQQEAFASSRVVATRTALDFTVHAQIADRGVRSNEFFVVLEFCPETLLDAILVILEAALAAPATVRVQIDHLETIDVQAIPLMQERRLYTFESRSGGIARNVRFKFISVSAGGA